MVNLTYQYRVAAQDADGDDLNYSLGSRPVGMTIDKDTGVVRFTPGGSQVGSHLVEIIVGDGESVSFSERGLL